MINFFPYKCFASPWHTNPFPFTGESVFILFSHYSQFCHLQQKNKTLRFSLPRSKSYHASVCCRASAVRKVMKEIVKFVDRIFLENLTQWRCGWIHFLYFFSYRKFRVKCSFELLSDMPIDFTSGVSVFGHEVIPRFYSRVNDRALSYCR